MIRRALCSASNCLKSDNRLRRYSLSRIDFCWRDDQSLLNHTYKRIIFLFVEWQYFFVVIRFRPRAPVSLWTKDSVVHLRCFSFLAWGGFKTSRFKPGEASRLTHATSSSIWAISSIPEDKSFRWIFFSVLRFSDLSLVRSVIPLGVRANSLVPGIVGTFTAIRIARAFVITPPERLASPF